MFFYPPTYYFVVVAAMQLSDHLYCPSTVGEFFAARVTGIAILACTLVFWYRLLRRTGVSPAASSLLTFGAGSLPVVSALFSSVQPDTLSAAFFATAVTFAAHWRTSPDKVWAPVFAIVSLATLGCVKEQYALAAWLGTAFVAIDIASRSNARVYTRCLSCAALLSILPIVFVASHSLFVPSSAIEALRQSTAPPITGAAAFSGLLDGLRDIYFDGAAFRSFWSSFGVRGSQALAPIVLSTVSCLSVATAITILFTYGRKALAFFRSSKVRNWPRAALSWLATFHFAVSYFALTAIVLVVYVRQSGGFQLEGRYWVPVLGAWLAFLARAVIDAHGHVIGNRILTIGAAVLIAFACSAQVSAIQRMSQGYYGQSHLPVRETVAAIDAIGTLSLPGIDGDVRVAARPAVPLHISGFAVDMETGLPARRVILLLGKKRIVAQVGLPSPSVARIFNDRELRDSGFSATIELNKSAGRVQHMNGYVVDANGIAIPFQKSIEFAL